MQYTYFHLLTNILQFLAALSPSLRSLDISYNHLADLDGSSLERLSNLQILRLHHNKISSIQKLGLANIQIIDLSSNQVVLHYTDSLLEILIPKCPSLRLRACSLVSLQDSPIFASSISPQTGCVPFPETPFRFPSNKLPASGSFFCREEKLCWFGWLQHFNATINSSIGVSPPPEDKL